MQCTVCALVFFGIGESQQEEINFVMTFRFVLFLCCAPNYMLDQGCEQHNAVSPIPELAGGVSGEGHRKHRSERELTEPKHDVTQRLLPAQDGYGFLCCQPLKKMGSCLVEHYLINLYPNRPILVRGRTLISNSALSHIHVFFHTVEKEISKGCLEFLSSIFSIPLCTFLEEYFLLLKFIKVFTELTYTSVISFYPHSNSMNSSTKVINSI